ncbi:MAG TPA: AMP-binding protein [Acidimicrobiales bacterium]|jgi:long-chain acyl-CoA synthetase|nr:AMP-binding protein [Acidimicrobiales bacterium]
MPADPQYGIPAAAAVRPGHPALVLGPEMRTYADLDDRAHRTADALSRLGVARGDRVGVMLPNSFEWFEVVHGAGRLGAVAVPVNIHFKAAETGWVLTDSDCRAVVVDPELAASLADVPGIPRLVVGDGYEEALADSSGRPPGPGPAGPGEGDGDGWPTTMVYTSGTTGRPKGVVPGGDDLRRTAAGMAGMGARWGFGPDDVHLLVGPSYHSGPAAFAQAHLALGATVVIMPRWDAESCLALIQDHRVTNTHMVPSNFIRILDLEPKVRASYDLSSLHVVLHAAAPCPVPVKRAFMELVGPEKVFEYFGATEGGGTAISPQEWLEHPGSVGRAIGGNEIVILDDEGRVLAPGEVGLVYVRPESAPFRYHRDDEKTSGAFKGERFTVGDMGYLDKDGYLFLTDRRADMVITGGVNVYPREIEDVLYLHPDVADCAVYGVPDERWGEALKAVVQPRAGASLDTDEVVAWCRERLADYKRPRQVAFVDELPRDPNGKIAKHRLRAAEA